MVLAVVLIVFICLAIAVLVVLLVDAFRSGFDIIFPSPEARGEKGTPPFNAVDTLLFPSETTPIGPTLEESEQRLAKNMRDPELRKIPPMVFSEIIQPRVDGKARIILFPRGPMPLVIAPRPEESIAEQINRVLQKQIAGTALAERHIRLENGGAFGMIVRVGSQTFDGIDAVTDTEAQAAIRAAVAEWEASR